MNIALWEHGPFQWGSGEVLFLVTGLALIIGVGSLFALFNRNKGD
jgi:hypothetical protein